MSRFAAGRLPDAGAGITTPRASWQPNASSTPASRRALSGSGGRLGSAATRRQLYEIAGDFVDSEENSQFFGDGERPEEFIDSTSGEGGTYVDFTATRPDEISVRIQTIDTLADGVTPTAEGSGSCRSH